MFEKVTGGMQNKKWSCDHFLKKKWSHEEMSVLLLKHTIESCNIDLAAYGLHPVRLPEM